MGLPPHFFAILPCAPQCHARGIRATMARHYLVRGRSAVSRAFFKFHHSVYIGMLCPECFGRLLEELHSCLQMIRSKLVFTGNPSCWAWVARTPRGRLRSAAHEPETRQILTLKIGEKGSIWKWYNWNHLMRIISNGCLKCFELTLSFYMIKFSS